MKDLPVARRVVVPRRRSGIPTSSMEERVTSELETEALSAAIAGFLASQVLMMRFLAKEGVIDKDRMVAYLENALEAMRPGIKDPRALMPLTQLLASLRAPGDDVILQ